MREDSTEQTIELKGPLVNTYQHIFISSNLEDF